MSPVKSIFCSCKKIHILPDVCPGVSIISKVKFPKLNLSPSLDPVSDLMPVKDLDIYGISCSPQINGPFVALFNFKAPPIWSSCLCVRIIADTSGFSFSSHNFIYELYYTINYSTFFSCSCEHYK